jgi:hypothetical protein
VVAWLSFGTDYLNNEWSWRIPALLQALPSVIQLIFIFWVPESPRYLMAKDKHEEALRILAKYHANGNANHPTVQFEYREIRETIRLEMENKKNSSYADFLKTKGNRYRLVVLLSLGVFSQWSGNAIISNYVSKLYDTAGVTDPKKKFGLSGGQTALALIVSVSMAMLVDRVGRRPMFLAATGGMFVTFALWTLSSALYEEVGAPGSSYAMIFFIWLFGIMYALAWSGLLVGYAIEILPYKLRAKGLMIMNISVQAALTLNIYANPLAFDFFAGHTWKFYLIYNVSCILYFTLEVGERGTEANVLQCWIFIELVFVYFMYVETKGPTLEELAKVIDGEDAKVAHLDIHQVEKEMDIAQHSHEDVAHKI